MNRRSFLGAILAAGAAPAIVKAASLMPVRAIQFPTLAETLEINIIRGNTLLTPTLITREALRVFEKNLHWARRHSQFFEGLQWRAV